MKQLPFTAIFATFIFFLFFHCVTVSFLK